jgi:hypothetical protein
VRDTSASIRMIRVIIRKMLLSLSKKQKKKRELGAARVRPLEHISLHVCASRYLNSAMYIVSILVYSLCHLLRRERILVYVRSTRILVNSVYYVRSTRPCISAMYLVRI